MTAQITLYQRTRRPRPLLLGGADTAILAAVNRYGFVTAALVCRLLYTPSGLSYTNKRIKRLADAGLLARQFLPRPSRSGTAPIVYSLAPRGRRFLELAGYEVGPRPHRAPTVQFGYLTLAHTLAVNDVLVAASLLSRQQPGIELAQLRHERELLRQPVRLELADGTTTTYAADGWLDFRLRGPDGPYQAAVLLELDRGTEKQAAWRRKVQALVRLITGPYREAFGTESCTVAVVCPGDERRCQELLAWTWRQLGEDGAQALAPLLLFTACPPATTDPQTLFLSPCWWQPQQRQLVSLLATPGREA